MRVVAFNASPKKDGNTAILLKTVLEELEGRGVDTELVQFGPTPLSGCIACYKCFENQDRRCSQGQDILNQCLEKMLAADGILLGSPTYFADVTSNMKSLLDRAGMVAKANNDMFRRKVGAAVVAKRRGGGIHALATMNNFFLISQMIVPGSSYWNMGLGLEPGQVEDDEEGLMTMRVLGENMAWVLKRLCG
ncbi:MAG: flavodoxin family protein [Desulfovibrionaceae bacterium]|nr:flavodoxin family protein [Desulfovibrionaceae bacterium]